MADFTLFEIHLHDGFGFGPTNSVPLLSKGVDALADADDGPHDDYDAEFDAEFDAGKSDKSNEADGAGSGGRPGLGLLVGLVLPVGIAMAVRYTHGGGDGLDELADLGDADDGERNEAEVDA